ncbi:MAG TPA: nucleotide exchange factor GrpE [Sphingobacteriaceae bacterium]|nr:nucleotide exchange factor GrpE [Sphingobacteriaceae bacterium]
MVEREDTAPGPGGPEPGESLETDGEGPGGQDGETAAGEGAAQVAELEAQLAARTEQLQRLQADFFNYRRRVQEEQQQMEQRAAAKVLAELLPVLDNLERAAAADGSGDNDEVREGVALILRQFRDILSAQGVERIEALGKPFDPQWHEAMLQADSDTVPDNHVMAELQAGYRMGNLVLRPALVQVARNPAGDAAAPAGDAPAEPGETAEPEEKAGE